MQCNSRRLTLICHSPRRDVCLLIMSMLSGLRLDSSGEVIRLARYMFYQHRDSDVSAHDIVFSRGYDPLAQRGNSTDMAGEWQSRTGAQTTRPPGPWSWLPTKWPSQALVS